MQTRGKTSADQGPSRPRSALSGAVARIRDVFWAIEDRGALAGGDLAGRLAEMARWPFERGAWALQRRVIWPLQDRFPQLDSPAGALALGGVIVVAAGAGVAALVLIASGGSSGSQAQTRVAVTPHPAAKSASPPPKAKEEAPTLHGAAPVFKSAKGGEADEVEPAKPAESPGAADSSAGAASTSTATTSSAATDTISSKPAAQASSAQASSAAPAVIAVAREFAGAFVVYETGGKKPAVRETFGKTATPELARSLLRRPPRLPANVKVPRAKVVNVVAGPSHGPVHSVSVSLLRVGVTSELRLDLERQKNREWRVTNVLG